jgi:Rho Binding
LSEKETELRKQMEREKDNFASHIKMMQDGKIFSKPRFIWIKYFNAELLILITCYPLDLSRSSSVKEELDRLKAQLKQEQLLKIQAVNKLAEIMNRKDLLSKEGKGKNKVSSADLRRKEKECRKLQQELTQVCIYSTNFCAKKIHTRDGFIRSAKSTVR